MQIQRSTFPVAPSLLTFYCTQPDPKHGADAVEVLIVGAGEGVDGFCAGNVVSTVDAWADKTSSKCLVVGKARDSLKASLSKVTEDLVAVEKPEHGYVLHPQAHTLF